MSLELTERGIGLEIIQHRLASVIFSELNDEIDRQQDLWTQRDLDWNNLTGQEPREVLVEYVKEDNFYKGNKPSLIEAPIENYPNVAVMVYIGNPGVEIIDQASNFIVVADVEAMVKGDSEEIVDARIHRMTEALHQIIVRNKGLNGATRGFENDPNVQITDNFKRREELGAGKNWYWQAVRLRYNIARHTNLPKEV